MIILCLQKCQNWGDTSYEMCLREIGCELISPDLEGYWVLLGVNIVVVFVEKFFTCVI